MVLGEPAHRMKQINSIKVNFLTAASMSALCQVTEQARLSVEACFKEAEEQRRTLEEKLLEAEKQKEALEEQKRKDLSSLEEQVQNPPLSACGDHKYNGFELLFVHYLITD